MTGSLVVSLGHRDIQIGWAHDIRELVGEQWKEAESERITWRALKETNTQQAVDM